MSALKSKTTQNSAAGQLASTGGVAGVLIAIREAWPGLIPWPVELDAVILAFVASTVGPWVSRQIAFLRNKEKRPEKQLNEPIHWCILLAFALLPLQACATTLPAVGGKTAYNVEFSDITAEQATTYRMNIRAPAGVDIAGLTGMSYDWAGDGSGRIAVNSEQAVDSTAQATLIAEVSRQQLEAFQAGVSTAINALVPVIGQYLNARVREGEIRAGVMNNAIGQIGTAPLPGASRDGRP